MQFTRLALILLVFLVGLAATPLLVADEPLHLFPKRVELKSTQIGKWKNWEGISNLEGLVSYRERITAIVADEKDLWVGTSHGRLLTHSGDDWTLQGTLKSLQITGVAIESPNKVWLSTSEGIRRLERNEDTAWKVSKLLTYYEGHPSFVSGGYLPGEDSVRRWGYVDDIYIPLQEKSYSPFVISNEHGLFCWGGYGRVWHHYMPHYWGANSAWLDTRELVHHRRPTCIVEDHVGHLWIGTEGDGIVRLNAHGRKYSDRNSENNKKDGTEFSFFGPDEIGFSFDRVEDLAAAEKQGLWAVLSSRKSGSRLAHFDGDRWKTLSLGEKLSPVCVVETNQGEIMVGVHGPSRQQGVRKVTWATQQVERPIGPEHEIRDIVQLSDGRVFAASWWSLHETSKP